MSSSSSRAVSMMIGTVLPARSRLQTSSPSSRGSIRSSTTRSTDSSAKRRSASSPSRATTTRKPSRSSGYVRSFWTESSSSTRRMVEASAIALAWYGRRGSLRSAYTSPVMAPPPRPSRPRRGLRRLRRGVPRRLAERPINARHGARARGSSSRCRCSSRRSRSPGPQPLPPPTLPPDLRRPTPRPGSRGDLADRYPDRSPGAPGALGAGRLVRAEQLRLYGFDPQVDSSARPCRASGRVELQNLVAVAPGPSPRRDRLPRAPGQHRLRRAGERQCLGNGGAGRAGARLRARRRRVGRAGATGSHARLRLDGRRRIRRTRRSTLRRDVEVSRTTPSRSSSSTRSPEPGAPRLAARRRRATLAVARARAHGGSATLEETGPSPGAPAPSSSCSTWAFRTRSANRAPSSLAGFPR